MMNLFILTIKLLVELHQAIIHLILKKNLTFGYIKNEFNNDELESNVLSIEVEKKYIVELVKRPLKQKNYKN